MFLSTTADDENDSWFTNDSVCLLFKAHKMSMARSSQKSYNMNQWDEQLQLYKID